MEEIQSQSDLYSSSSSSASSPSSSRVPSSYFFYVRKPGSLTRPISFEDSPEWEDTDAADVRIMDQEANVGGGGDSINDATATPISPSLSKINSGSMTSRQGGGNVVRKIAGASIAWKDLTVTMKGKKRYSDKVVKLQRLLWVLPRRLTPSAKMYGDVFVNGSKSHMPYGSYGYVERETQLIGSLTVREFLYYSPLLQLPGFLCQKMSVVEDAIQAMSLSDYSNKLIGGGHCYMKGLRTGERRRVSIARELVMRPHILFIDEPLHHLDSVSALLMMVTLKKLASMGCTLVFTIYQNSTEVFGLFDRICLLSNGNTLFFGETLACLQIIFLRAINTDFDRIIAMCKNWQDDNGDFSAVNMDTAVAISTLEATYKSSADAASVETMIFKLTEREGSQLKSKGKAGAATRVAVLTWRSLLVMSREWKYYWIRLILYLILTLCIGTLYSGLGHSLSSVSTRVAAVFVFVFFASLLGIAGIPSLFKEIKFLGSIPFLFLMSISSSLVFYFMVGLRDDFDLLMYFVLNFFMCLLVTSESVTLCQNPYGLNPLAYISFHTYSIQGLLENEYLGEVFAIGEVRSTSGYEAVGGDYQISPGTHSKWRNMLVLLAMAFGYRLIVYVLLPNKNVGRLLLCHRKNNG
ncbi:hypothetical protein Bca52824_028183 [Brassica carinata]|uniref:ABC transporter domain-containing protein n=1 Tax=Brassica carinata TaxID=52824 RepID=A0A8X7VBS6_BRACI|nr:hypothetical protein Bca52824_028183 [Brassica carinata]